VQRVEDMGNYKLVTAVFEGHVIKVKVERDIAVPADRVELQLPAENCCVYAADILVL
jgi:glycerol transport system ATP-binding protein